MSDDSLSGGHDVSIDDKDVRTRKTKLLDPPIALVREGAAAEVASKLIWVFGFALFGAFAVIFALIVVALRFPDAVANKLAGEVDELLRVLQVVGTIFSPLLAFILGYYFGSPHHTDNHRTETGRTKESE